MDLEESIKEHINVCERLSPEEVKGIAQIIVSALKKGNKLLICGNGGSAADAQHFAAELTGRYKKERKGLPAIALTTDTSALTAIWQATTWRSATSTLPRHASLVTVGCEALGTEVSLIRQVQYRRTGRRGWQ